jgi:Ca2+-binding EF-hand superfamily protein
MVRLRCAPVRNQPLARRVIQKNYTTYMKNLVLVIALASAGGAAFAAAKPDLTKLPPASTQPGLTYEKDIRPLFEASCFRCHGPDRQRGKLRLDSLEAALKGGEDGKVILPGKSIDSHLVLAVSRIDDESAMPPKPGAGQGGRGRAGGGGGPRGTGANAGGGGGRGQGMFGRGVLAQMMVEQADKDKDQKLTKAEFTALADSWFDKLDSDKAGKLTQTQFTERLRKLLIPTQEEAPAGANQRAGGGSAYVFNGLFTAADRDKDGSVTRAELKTTFEKWYADWDSEKSGAITEEHVSAGLRAALPQQGGGGFGGPGGGVGAGGPGGGARGQGGPEGGTGGRGPAPKPLTAEQVGLVRAWIDQGAK